MKCEEYQILIGEYLDGEVRNGRVTALFTHLSECAECRSMFTASVAFKKSVKGLPAPSVPSSLDRRIEAIGSVPVSGRYRDRMAVSTFWRKAVRVPVPVVMLVVIMTAVLSFLIVQKSAGSALVLKSPEPQYVYIMELAPVEVKATHLRSN
jgi:predicted anti-sigma-YlaC factor YlaD